MLIRLFDVGEVVVVHDDVPVGEVRIVPPLPTAANIVPDQAMPFRLLTTVVVCAVHNDPSGEVMIAPPSPTAANIALDDAMAFRLVAVDKVEVCDVHTIPSEDLTMAALAPTAAKALPDQAMPLRSLDLPEDRRYHAAPS
jgi:hypothetical protein